MINLRSAQRDIVAFSRGRMGVSAVPGSGKTHTLSALAARLIVRNLLNDDQEILIVTLVNSAVDNFISRVSGFLRDAGLLPDFGYRVRTLHGLAHDIVRERPDLAGLDNRFVIVDESESTAILQSSVQSWMAANPDFLTQYTHPDLGESDQHKITVGWQRTLPDICGSFIRYAKDRQASPEEIQQKIKTLSHPHPLLSMGCEVYADYQRALNYRNGVDFDDLIRLALRTLQTDPDYLLHLRYRWPFILEDEAQDSSRLQEEILRLLCGNNGNWVRVGDPNQAIYETFTTANPQFLINFLREPGVEAKTLPDSGRSTASIIRLANHLIKWTRSSHPTAELREALVLPLIQPVLPTDAKPNPPDNPQGVILMAQGYSPEDEIQMVVKSVVRWLPDHSQDTVAILVPRNERGAEVAESLKKHNIEPVELLRTSLSTRQTSELFTLILRSLADPANPAKLEKVYRRLFLREEEEPDHQRHLAVAGIIRKFSTLEDYLYPISISDWQTAAEKAGHQSEVVMELTAFRELIKRWHAATNLPIDQLLLTIAQDIFSSPTDLALAHKFALVLERAAQAHPAWHLSDFAEELDSIARNERKFLGFSEEETGFNPDDYPGKVVVATIHKAKGLEWDRVYLLSVNNYDFPSVQGADTYIAEKWFVYDHLNLQAESLARLKALLEDDIPGASVEDGLATLESRYSYAAERLRLLFVGITRARKELIITWNTGRNGNCHAATPLEELIRFWSRDHASAA